MALASPPPGFFEGGLGGGVAEWPESAGTA